MITISAKRSGDEREISRILEKFQQAWREQIKHFCRRVFSRKKKNKKKKKKDASTLKNKWEGKGDGENLEQKSKKKIKIGE